MTEIKGVIIERGLPGHDGYRIDLDGLEIPETVYVVKDFNYSVMDCLGFAKCYLSDGVLKADITFKGELQTGYPAIGCHVKGKSELGEVWTLSKLEVLSICSTPNQDEGIKPIICCENGQYMQQE